LSKPDNKAWLSFFQAFLCACVFKGACGHGLGRALIKKTIGAAGLRAGKL